MDGLIRKRKSYEKDKTNFNYCFWNLIKRRKNVFNTLYVN